MRVLAPARDHSPVGSAKSAIPAAKAALARPGRPLDHATRVSMETRFGHDFSRIRVHADAEAEVAASEIGARAFTMESDIGFAAGAYAPQSEAGKSLVEHELTHVVQQRADGARRIELDVGPDHRVKELEDQLQTLIEEGTWANIRKRVYPQESAPGVTRAHERHAGKRPDLTGLGKLTVLKRFVAEIREIQRIWPAMGPSTRVLVVGAAAGVELQLVDVPPFESVEKEAMTSKAFFSPPSWSFHINEDLIDHETLYDADAEELSKATLHEARHAEQDFLAARYSAGVLDYDAATISSLHHIPLSVAREAVAKKFDDQTDPKARKMGKSMFAASVEEGQRNQQISDAVDEAREKLNRRRGEAEAALTELRTSPTSSAIRKAKRKLSALRKQILRVESRYKAYRHIPYEQDAHEAGDAAGEEFKNLPALPRTI